MKVLIDTNILNFTDLIKLLIENDVKLYLAKTTADREVHSLDTRKQIIEINIAPERFIFGESSFPFKFGSNKTVFEILKILSSGSFPNNKHELSKGELNQLRDALIFEAAINNNCNIFCTNDNKAFRNNGKKELFELKYSIKICNTDEMFKLLNNK